MKSAPFVVLLLPFGLVACSGCGESKPVGYVSGTVTFDGEPVAEGNKIYFEQSSKGIIAGAVIGTSGEYSLNYNGEAGIPLGDYVVYVGPPDSNMTQQEFYELKRKVDAEYKSRGETPPPSPDWVLPPKFYRPATSPLRKTIEPGENTIEISVEG